MEKFNTVVYKYTKQKFGIELREKINNKFETEEIGSWAFSMYIKHMQEIDLSLSVIILKLAIMEQGPEFARSYEELEKIADRLIAGKDVKL